jgi:hypothetical protein
MIEESISGNSNCRSTTLSYLPEPDFSLSLAGRNSCRSTIELEDGFGARMRVHLRGCELPDLADLCRSFRRRD